MPCKGATIILVYHKGDPASPGFGETTTTDAAAAMRGFVVTSCSKDSACIGCSMNIPMYHHWLVHLGCIK